LIITVTPNTGIDRTLFVPSFELNRTIRASQAVIGMAGKASDASWVLGELGVPNLALGFAAGETGKRMDRMLRARGVETDFTWVAGDSRENILIVSEDGRGQSTITVDSLKVAEADIRDLFARYQAALERATCILLGGSLPAGVSPAVFTEMVGAARRRDIPVVLDASGPALQAGLSAGPSLVKPNRQEMEELTGRPLDSLQAVYAASLDLQQKYGASFVVTLGGEGALASLPGRAYRIPPLPVKAVSTAGAGDGILAGLAAALSREESFESGLRLGFAAAGAVLLTPATADCRREDVERLIPQVQLIPYRADEPDG
jgi:1-phosphofructokinase family hexose kinase